MGFDPVRPLPSKDEQWDEVTEKVIGSAIEVHRELGPGLTEIMYEEALCHEFELRGIRYERQVPVAAMYKGKEIGKTRLDLVVGGKLIVDLKSCDGFHPVQRAQMICYLTVTKLRVGLIINFNVPFLKDGVKRVVLNA